MSKVVPTHLISCANRLLFVTCIVSLDVTCIGYCWTSPSPLQGVQRHQCLGASRRSKAGEGSLQTEELGSSSWGVPPGEFLLGRVSNRTRSSSFLNLHPSIFCLQDLFDICLTHFDAIWIICYSLSVSSPSVVCRCVGAPQNASNFRGVTSIPSSLPWWMLQNRKIFNALYASMNFHLPNVSWHHGDLPSLDDFLAFGLEGVHIYTLTVRCVCSKKWCYLFESIVFNLIFFTFFIWYLGVPLGFL